MADAPRSWWRRIVSAVKVLFWLFIIILVVQQSCAPHWLNSARTRLLENFQKQRKSRVIAMIHREDTVSFFGLPVSNYIGIEDSEAVLRAIRLTPDEQPIDVILHTPGGLVLAAEQIARALVDHKGKVTVFVPHYAMRGGTLIALAANEIVMDPNAVLGPVDPQIGGLPAASILSVLDRKEMKDIDDQTLILADVARKAVVQVQIMVRDLLMENMTEAKASEIAVKLGTGTWTHDYAITAEEAKTLGLPVST